MSQSDNHPPPADGDALASLRAGIDEIDGQIARLLHDRAAIVAQVRKAKLSSGTHVYDPEREETVLDRALTRAQGSFPKVAMRAVFREIISGCVSLQSSATVAFLGPSGTFTEMAAHALFGSSTTYDERPTIQGVLDAVMRETAAYGVVPLETSDDGVVIRLIEGLIERSLKIRREFIANVTFALCSNAPELSSIERVYAHHNALGQCRRWLLENLPHAGLVSVESPGEAMRRAKADPQGATLASEKAARRSGMPVIARSASDRTDSTIRFIVVGREDGLKGLRMLQCKTLVAIVNRELSLSALLSKFAAHTVDVLQVTSVPRTADGAPVLLFELDGKRSDSKMAALMAEIEASSAEVHVLGTFARHHAVYLSEPPSAVMPISHASISIDGLEEKLGEPAVDRDARAGHEAGALRT
jgi:chorismate mutase/prephenate dehydratase